MTNATEVLNNGKLLIKRMKLIRLADRNTWATVQEYVSDDLASDTDDDQTYPEVNYSGGSKERQSETV